MSAAAVRDGAARQTRRGGVPIFASDGTLVRRVSQAKAEEVAALGGEWRGGAVYLSGVAGGAGRCGLDGLHVTRRETPENARGCWTFKRAVRPLA